MAYVYTCGVDYIQVEGEGGWMDAVRKAYKHLWLHCWYDQVRTSNSVVCGQEEVISILSGILFNYLWYHIDSFFFVFPCSTGTCKLRCAVRIRLLLLASLCVLSVQQTSLFMNMFSCFINDLPCQDFRHRVNTLLFDPSLNISLVDLFLVIYNTANLIYIVKVNSRQK